MNTQEFSHGLTDFGVAGSLGKTLVLGGRWFSHHKKERDLDNLESVIVRESGIRQPWEELNFSQLCKDFSNIRYIDIEYEKIDTLDWIAVLGNLQHLGVRCKTIRKADANQFAASSLLSLSVTGHEALLSLISPSVETLKIVGYKTETLENLRHTKLKSLEIIRAPKLISLKGLSEFQTLSYLSIYSAPKLANFSDAIASQSLRKLSLQSCRSLDPPRVVPGGVLTYLSLLDCMNISDVRWIGALTELENLRIAGTTVGDGKVEFLKNMRNLKMLFIENKKDYDCFFENQT